MKLGKNNFVVTFKTEDEVLEYFKMHNGEEQRLLWLGFFIANNYIAQRLEDEGMELAKPWPQRRRSESTSRSTNGPGIPGPLAMASGTGSKLQAPSRKLQASSRKLDT